MRFLYLGSLLLTGLASVHAASQAPATSANPVPKVSPGAASKSLNMESFRFLLGRWHGQGTFAGSGEPISSTMTFSIANSKTIEVHAEEISPNTYKYAALWSQETGSGRMLMLMASNQDGPALYHSAGWVDDRMVFEPDPGIATGSSTVRFTYIRTNQNAFELTYEYSVQGTWHIGDKQVFTRVEGQAPAAYAPKGNSTIEPANPAPVGSEQNPARVSSGVMAGNILHKDNPVFPSIPKDQHVSGATVLGVIIDPEGKVQKVTVISGPEVLRDAVVENVRHWTYKPFLLNSRPVFVRTTVTMNIDFGG